MLQYSLELALFDYVPVTLSAIGFFYIAQFIAGQQKSLAKTAYTAIALIVLGGLCKATWKLLVAAEGLNYAYLNNMLFILMMPGFFLLCFCFWQARSSEKAAANWSFVLIPLFSVLAISAALAASFPEKRTWFFVLLMGVTLSSTFFSILAIQLCIRQRLFAGAGLFSINLLANYLMAGLARTGDHSEGMQWIEQSINSLSQLGFMFAAWLLYRHYRATQYRVSLAY